MLPTSTISFPSVEGPAIEPERPQQQQHSLTTHPNLSLVSIQNTSREVCYFVYGDTDAPFDAVERFYEPNAVYENPVVTATSRSMISEIFQLSRSLGAVDVPRPIAALCAILRIHLPSDRESPLLRAVRAWTEINDINESESFDGHRKCIIEHTLHILLLPDIHVDSNASGPLGSTASTSSELLAHTSPPHPHSPSLRVPGTSLSLPSPLHIQFHITSKVSFNEQGRITYHRDLWDLRDLVGLVPGASIAQWVTTRIAARGLSYVSRSLMRSRTPSSYSRSGSQPREGDLERGGNDVLSGSGPLK